MSLNFQSYYISIKKTLIDLDKIKPFIKLATAVQK